MPAYISSKLFTMGALALGSMALDSVSGWDTFRDYDLSLLRPNETTSQFSSYDRNGGNDDGFEGTFSCLKPMEETDGRCVIADYTGAGEVGSIWFTYDSDSIAKAGDIQIILDGTTVLDADLQSVVNGEQGAPFSWPLVGNTDDTRGGNVIKVPMPFKESMLISTGNNPHFYHVSFRKFTDAQGVKTFDPSEGADDILRSIQQFGNVDPKPAPVNPKNVTIGGGLKAGASMPVGTINGTGQITELDLRLDGVVRAPHVHDDGRAFGANGGSCMNFTVDPSSESIRIVRRVDLSVGQQVATATLDGVKIPDWETGPQQPETWMDQVTEANVTLGTSNVRLCNTFDSSDEDVNEFFYTVHSKVNNLWVLTDRLDVGPTNPNDEAIHGYTIDGQTWEGLRFYHYDIPVEEAEAALDVTNNLYLKFNFDGYDTIRAPVGSFFATGLGKFDVRSLLVSVDATEGGSFKSWWPMPFAESASLEFENDSGEDISFRLDVIYDENNSIGEDLQSGARGYFSTGFNRQEAEIDVPWEFLKTTGRGIVYGTSQAFRGYETVPPQSLGYLEGDEMVWVNGEEESTYLGTGTEDYYESGWYFTFPGTDIAGVPYYMPQAGMVGHEAQELDCVGECVSAYRWLVSDPIPFDNGINFQIEHGSNNDVKAFYDTVTYFYAAIEE